MIYQNGVDHQCDHPIDILLKKALKANLNLFNVEFAKLLDEEDELYKVRDDFHYPKMKNLKCVDKSFIKEPEEECIYFCGHSLGLMPKNTQDCIQRELDKWRDTAIEGHTNGVLPWAFCDEKLIDQTALLIGSKPNEVCLMNSLTINEHLLLISFYQPTKQRYKIMLEKQAFPSDHYCIESQIIQRGLDPKDCMAIISPREGEFTIRHEDILDMIEKDGEAIAVILLGGVQYYTGQLFNMDSIVKAGHAKGCYVGFDLAHAIGNVPLHLHDWDVDFACWCSYKYLCSSAGSMGGIYVHERFANYSLQEMPKLLGWWSHKIETRFQMTNILDLTPGPLGYRISNPPGLLAASVEGSLKIFEKTSMATFRKKSLLMSAYFEYLLNMRFGAKLDIKTKDEIFESKCNDKKQAKLITKIITPSDPQWRGCQFSIIVSTNLTLLFKELSKRGVMLDKREPLVLRLSINPFYNRFEEIHRFMDLLEESHSVLKNVVH